MGQAALKLESSGELLPIKQIAERLRMHRQTVAARLEDLGYQPHESSTAKNQLYWFDEEMEFAIKAAKDEASAVRIRGLRAKAELDELKLARERGELVPMHEVVELVQNIGTTLYQEYTVRMPKRIGVKLAKAKNIAQVKAELKRDSDRTMKLLRDNFEEFIKQ